MSAAGYLERLGRDLRAEGEPRTRPFAQALRVGPSVAIVAEVKRASPSEGAIAPDADPVERAGAYAAGGAAALSVLCAERDFGGSPEDLTAARAAVPVPVLAKDFLLYPDHVARCRLAGADAVLVILALVYDDEAARLLAAADALGMDALVEVHDAGEAARARALGARVIGVNARDLNTLAVDVPRQLRLVESLPDDVVRVAESGVASRADVERARDAGADAVLVGTALMRRPGLLAELVGVAR